MPVTFLQQRLDNGLTILAEVDPRAHTAACGFFVNTGARDEQAPWMGVSHFLEHMMFKGTERRSAEDVNREFDELGASYNAFTSHEITAFHAHTLPEFLPRALDLLADILRPALRQSDFETEKGVILEEIAMYKDQPFWVLYERAMEEYFGGHPLGFRVLGTEQTVRDLERERMSAYFESRYASDNTILAAAGRLDFDALVHQASRVCASWRPSGVTRVHGRPETRTTRFEVRDPKISRAYLLGVAPAPAMQDHRRYAAGMLARVLGESDNSRLHWALVEPGIAEDCQSAFDGNDGVGVYYVFASCDPERAEEVWSIIEREIAGLVASLRDGDLERLRNKAATAVVLAGERPSGRMHRLGRLWPYLGRHLSLEEELQAINAVTLQDLRDVADAFPMMPRTVGTMLPQA